MKDRRFPYENENVDADIRFALLLHEPSAACSMGDTKGFCDAHAVHHEWRAWPKKIYNYQKNKPRMKITEVASIDVECAIGPIWLESHHQN